MQLDPKKLKKVLDDSGLTAREVSDAAGWDSPRRIWQILKGKSTNINPRIGEAIARKLKVSTDKITAGA